MAGSSSELKFIVKVESQLAALEKQLAGVQKELDRAERAGNKAGKTIGASMQSAGGKITGVGKNLTLGVTLPVVAVGVAATKTAGDFEQGMNVLQSASGATSQEIEKLSALALQMGADTVFSANDAAGAMVELAKQGLTPAQIASGGLGATMSLAAADGMELADAATVAANTMNVFGLQAKDSGKIADALAGGAASSSASVSSLAQALSQSALGAKNAGMNLNETVGVLSAFDAMGLKGSDAGTSLKTMLTRLVPATDEAAEAMKRYGLDFTDAQGNILPFSDVADQLQKKLGKLSEEERTAALNMIFGSDAARAATVAMNLGKSGVEKYTLATMEQGAAQKMADARMKGTKGSIEAMNGSLETAALTLGQTMAPYVTLVAGKVAELANWFAALDGRTKTVVLVLATLAAVIPPILIGVGALVSAIGAIIGATWLWTAAQTALNFVMSINPVIALITVAALLAVGLAALIRKTNEAGSQFGGFADDVARVNGKLGEGNTTAGALRDVYGRLAIVADDTARATDRHAAAIDAVRIAQQTSTNVFAAMKQALLSEEQSQVRLTSANLALERAQARVNELKKAGATKTIEYREAMNQLDSATLGVTEAQNAHAKAANDVAQAEAATDAAMSAKGQTIATLQDRYVGLATTLQRASQQSRDGVNFGPSATEVQTQMNEIAAELEKLGAKTPEIGAYASQGFALGISSGMGDVRTASESVAGTVSASTAAKLQEKSPSRVMFGHGENAVRGLINGIKSLVGGVRGAMASVVTAITAPMNTASKAVADGVAKITRYFSGLRIRIPKIPLPHFRISGSFSLKPPSAPSFAVDWYSTGGSFSANSPTLIGVGDQRKGSEHVLRDDQIVTLMKAAIGDGKSGDGSVVVQVDARGATAADAARIGSATVDALKTAVRDKNVHLRLMTSGA